MMCPMQCSAEAICGSLAVPNAFSAGTGALKQNSGYAWVALRFCGTNRFWTLPVLTYIVVRSLGMNGLVWPLT